MKKADIGYLNINFEEQNGGGSTISKSLSRIISDEKRMCLCIVDSDKKYKEASPGNTMKNIIDIIDEKVQVYFVEIFPLEIHEIENLIPISIMEKVIDKNNWEKQGLEFIKYLTKIDATEKSPRFYFDLKEGILKSSFILENEKDDEIVKKYRKKKQYREYWEKYIEDFGVEINNDSENVLIKGICKKILEHREHVLPNNIKKMCIELTRKLNLNYSAIDMILDENNDYVFLEINPNGQWAWIENKLQFPISKKIVDLLVEGE